LTIGLRIERMYKEYVSKKESDEVEDGMQNV
jgi:hypothetical protein